MEIVKSLAGTNREYVVGQVTTTGYPSLHIQIDGPAGNREYGFAVTLKEPLPKKLEKWFSGVAGSLNSLAGTQKQYVPVQFAVRFAGTVHCQIAGPKGNRDYGVTFDIVNSDLEEYVNQVFQVVEEKKLAMSPQDVFTIS